MIGVFKGIGAERAAQRRQLPPGAVLLRENCCVGIPRHPACCSVATTNLADRGRNAVQAALAELADGFGMAEAGLIVPASMAVISGRDPRATATRRSSTRCS